MVENSKIEWCDCTFNPWTGCTKVSPACDHCYAEAQMVRRKFVEWGPHAERRRTSTGYWLQPIKWNKRAEREGRRLKVFCASLADVFDNAVPVEWRTDLWRLIRETPFLDWLLLTKRPQNIAKMLPGPIATRPWPWPNVWLGTTVENQEEAERRIPHLLAVPAAKRFLSCEPLLGAVDLTDLRGADHQGTCYRNALNGEIWHPGCGSDSSTTWRDGPRIDWVIAGGESGPGARPMHPDWARSLRDQCQAAGVLFFFKQWGEHLIAERRTYFDIPDDAFFAYQDGHEEHGWTEHDDIVFGAAEDHRGDPKRIDGEYWASGTGLLTRRVGKAKAGALLDGREWREMPA